MSLVAKLQGGMALLGSWLWRPRSAITWVIASGRLKKVHVNQLRRASERERERLVAQGTTQLTLPWTFLRSDWLDQLKGEYDSMTDRQQREEAKADSRRESYRPKRGHQQVCPRALQPAG